MKIKLLDYASKVHEVEIDDNTDHIAGKIISGDTVMTYPIYYDTGETTRTIDFFDGSFVIPAAKFTQMNQINDSYELFSLTD